MVWIKLRDCILNWEANENHQGFHPNKADGCFSTPPETLKTKQRVYSSQNKMGYLYINLPF